MQFTFTFLSAFYDGITLVGPLLIFLAVIISLLSQVVGHLESWDRLDALYWAFITATTVGYGDIRPMGRLSKGLSVLIALVGMIFTGIMVALAVSGVTYAFKIHHPGIL